MVFKLGSQAWNKNKKCWREYVIGHSTKGKKLTDITRYKMVRANLKRWQSIEYQKKMRGVFAGNTYKSGIRADLGFYVRSSWEANFARLLLYLGILFKYEPKRFLLKEDSLLFFMFRSKEQIMI